jgi:hypothetical protein
MRVINVITIENDVIQDIESFGIFEEQLSQEVVEKAEALFLQKAREYGWTEDEISEADLLDDGRYETEFTVYANVNICWSEI